MSPDHIEVERIKLESSLGFEVSADLRRPVNGCALVGVAIFCHGFSGTKYSHLTTSLAAAGYVAISIDFPGYGNTLPGSGRVLPIEQIHLVREFADYADASFGPDKLPIVLVGASLGGAVALLAAQQDKRFKAIVLAHPLASGLEFLERRYPDKASMEQFWNRVEIAELTGDKLHRSEIALLPKRLTGFLPGDTAMEFTPRFATQFAALSVLGVVAKLAPRRVLVLHCDGDPMITTADVQAIVEGAQGNAKLHLMEGGDHFIFDSPEVIDLTIRWLDDATRGPTTPADYFVSISK